MSDSTTTKNDAPFPGAHWAVGLGAGLVIALFLILFLAVRDNGRRTMLETTIETTAVGDTHYYPSEHLPAATEPIAFLHGQPLYLYDYRRHETPADDMTRVGVDEKAGYIIYTAPVHPKDEDDRKEGFVYWLKISPTEYLKTRAGKPNPNLY